MYLKKLNIFIFLFLLLAAACQTATKQESQPAAEAYVSQTPVPEWSRDAVIYEANIRQYTPEGTFKAFAEHLPALKELGVDILWIMPIYPIGEKNRKGTLGSYYSVKDYTAINPEFGTLSDFEVLVEQAHAAGMKVILDWVANHTAWDNPWITEHPEWYLKNEEGEIISPVEDWSDVAGLNYENQALRQAMTDALIYWVKETDVDGYRCDVAGMVPVDFWESARARLDSLKPVFMLAEDEENMALLEKAFNANYGWSFHHLINEVSQGKKDATHLTDYFQKIDTLYPKGTYPMQFITNHDENSWNGSAPERLGDALMTMAALTFTVEGMPLIYSGQEAGLNKRLSFFDKDQIDWGDREMTEFYQQLTALKAENPALWNGTAGGKLQIINTNNNKNLFCFSRQKDSNTIVALFNLSDTSASLFAEEGPDGEFRNVFTGQWETLPLKGSLMQPWEFKIFSNTADEQ